MIVYSTLYIPTITSQPKNGVSAAIAAPTRLNASKYPSNLAQSLPQSPSLSSLGLDLQVHLKSPSITASECFSEFTPSRPPSAYQNSRDRGLPVHVQIRLITATKCIPEFTRSRPPTTSPYSLNHALQVHLRDYSMSVSNFISLLANHGLLVQLQT
jgi:hypothetical protein